MSQASIFLPVMALVGWTMIVLLVLPYRRFKMAFAGQVTADDFKYGESDKVPASATIPNRVFMNLLEVPVLFYVLCLIAYVAQIVTPGAIMLAWAYFALRVVHSLVYLTYNHVIHRFLAFATSNVVLVILWVRLLTKLPL